MKYCPPCPPCQTAWWPILGFILGIAVGIFCIVKWTKEKNDPTKKDADVWLLIGIPYLIFIIASFVRDTLPYITTES